MDPDVARMTIGRHRTMTVVFIVLSPLSLLGVVMGVMVARNAAVQGLFMVVLGIAGLVGLVTNVVRWLGAAAALRGHAPPRSVPTNIGHR